MPDWARRLILLALVALAACAPPALSPDAPISCDDCAEWNLPQAPFHIFGNTYYVGTAGLSSLLIDSGHGLFLFDGGLPQSAELIAANIRELGFSVGDVRMIALSHAHFDHAGGIAALQRISNARVLTSHDAARALARGGILENDPQFGGGMAGQVFPAVVDPISMEDGATVALGDVTVRGVYTPGHTAGGMSWTWQSCEQDRCLDIVYADSTSPVSRSDYRYSDGMDEVLRASLERIANLDCDIMFATHAFVFGMQAKLEQGRQAFIDDQACKNYAERTTAFIERRLAAENP